jgi:hypothetical protein
MLFALAGRDRHNFTKLGPGFLKAFGYMTGGFA